MAAFGKKLGRKALAKIAQVAKPETIRLVSQAGGAEVRWLEAPLLPGSA